MLAHAARCHRYAFVAGTAGGGVAVIRTADYALVDVIPTGAGAHMAAVTPDDSAVWVANIGARSFTEIEIDLDAETFALSGRELEVDGEPLYEAIYGAWRDDDTPAPPAPVCHQYTADGQFAYLTLGPGPGGLVVVDISLPDPEIVEAFDPEDVGANCGVALSHDGSPSRREDVRQRGQRRRWLLVRVRHGHAHALRRCT